MCAAASSHSAETVRVLLSRGADFSATNTAGDTAEAYARGALDHPTRDAFPDDEDRDAWDEDSEWRLAGEAERVIELLADVRSAGSWKRFVGADLSLPILKNPEVSRRRSVTLQTKCQIIPQCVCLSMEKTT